MYLQKCAISSNFITYISTFSQVLYSIEQAKTSFNALLKALYHKGFKSRMQEKRLHLHYFMPTYTLPLENRTFLTKIPLFQKLKMAIYKGLMILEEQKYHKIRVVNCRFLNFYVRLRHSTCVFGAFLKGV